MSEARPEERADLAPGLDREVVARVVHTALAEDLGPEGDVTTQATVDADTVATARLVSRQRGVVAGLPVAAYVFDVVGEGRVEMDLQRADGDRVEPGHVLAVVRGPLRDLLTAERTALNLLGHLSGVASLTRQWADAIAGTSARVRDTRKTMPGLRHLEKYAVRVGGGVNHRMSLSDAALVKDNHVVAAGGVVPAFRRVREQYPGLPLEIEVDTVAQAREVIEAGADLVLLDNMPPAAMHEVVEFAAGRAWLEASGRLSLDNARAVAESGVHYLAVGALTHSAPVLDIGLDM
ncbi:carboxylating nicotinate-nucleotide diphosphorylase [uncultured Jatrophihabitans sp.]|uniref:carboxylating nicotinate-nucleotide diphosphorylase n=1 Tax=uncultured Jatrophihabitans sp. TaxID=1610747 RepID=UPI0035CB20FE